MSYNEAMSGFVTTIGVKLITSFLSDRLRSLAGETASPLADAIASTEQSFDSIEGVGQTLRQWLEDPRIAEVLQAFIEGVTGRDELSIPELVESLLNNTQFYLPEHSRPTAEKIVATFLTKLRGAYLADPRVGTLHIANRQEAGFGFMGQKVDLLNTNIQNAGGLRPALQKQFEQAAARLEEKDYPASKAMFCSLLETLHLAPIRERELERRIEVNLGKISSSLGEFSAAISHYRQAAQLDDDLQRAAVNSAVADLLEQKPHDALHRLEAFGALETPSYEFLSAKTFALISLQRFQEAIDTANSISFPDKESLRSELLGLAYRESQDFANAERAYQRAVDLDGSRPEALCALANVLFTPAIDHRNQSPGTPLPANLKQKLDAAAMHLDSASQILRRQGRTRAAFEVDASLAIVKGLQNQFEEVIRLLEPVTELPESGANSLRTLGYAYLCTNATNKAIVAFERALAKESDSDTEYLYAQALLMGGRIQDSLVFSSGKSTQPISNDNLKWHLLNAAALAGGRSFAKARQVMTLVQRQFPNHAEVLLTVAGLCETTGSEPDAAAAYQQALENASGALEIRVRYEYGGFCLRRKDYARAVELWRPLIQYDTRSTLLDTYLAALYNSRNFGEVATIASARRLSGEKATASFADVAATAYEALDDLGEARYWLEYLCDNFGNKPERSRRLSVIRLRLGHRDEAIELLDASRMALKDPSDMIGHAQAYSLLGRHREAIELGHQAAQLTIDADIHLAYMGIFLAVDESVDRTKEEIAVFQEITRRFKERFPESSRFQSFPVDPEHPVDAIFETLTRLSKRSEDAIELYKKNGITLGMFARCLGRDLYHTWVHTIANDELVINTALGTYEEANNFQRLLSTAPGFIIDPIALFTFSFLGLPDRLLEIGDLYVAQRVLDKLHEWQASRRPLGKQTGLMGVVDGKFFMEQVSPDETEKIDSALRAATSFVEERLRIMGLKESLSPEDEKWAPLLGAENLATLVAAKQSGLVLITDDRILAELGRQNYSTSYVNTQSVLFYLASLGKLAVADYNKAVLKLVEAGYTFTRIDEGQMFEVIVEEQFQLTPRLKRIFRALEPASVDVTSACTVVAGIIRRVFLETLPSDTRERLTFHLLDVAATEHPKIEVQRLVRRFVRLQMNPMLFYQLSNIEKLLDRW